MTASTSDGGGALPPVAFDASAFAPDAILAFGTVSDDATASRSVARGRRAAADLFGAGAPGRRTVVACVREGDDCFAEWQVSSVDGTPPATVGASMRLDRAGAIVRMLALSSPPLAADIGSVGSASVPGPQAGRQRIDRYFQHLAGNDFAATAACFTDDCQYSHPPYSRGGSRARFESAAELLDGLTRLRGPRVVRATVDRYVQHGASGFLEGSVPGDPGGSFLASFTFAGDGRIRRYVTWFCTPAAPR